MLLTVKQAAEATGKSKPTILRSIQAHRISATKDELTGAWMIDPAELHRVYPPASEQPVRTEPMMQDASADEVASLRREVVLLTSEREREREQLQARIDDLSRRLDAEAEERRRLTAILTDQRAKAPEVIPMPPPASPAPVEAQPAPPPHASPTPARNTQGSVPEAQGGVPKVEAGWFRRMMGGK